MKRRFRMRAVIAGVAAAGVLSSARGARAQEIQLTGPLKGAPAVRHMRLYREGRFDLAVTESATLLDEYRRTFLTGLRLTYNIKDWIGVGVWGALGAISTTTALADEIDQGGNGSLSAAPRNALTAPNVNHTGSYPNYGYASFNAQTAQISYLVAPQLTFIPFRGKIAIFNKIFVDSDLYLAAGGALVGIKERQDCGGTGQVSCVDPSSFALQDKTKIAPTFGVGFAFYAGNFVSLGVEYRALPFSWNRAGFDSRGAGTNGNFPDGQINSQDETFKFNQMVTISVGFSLPAKPRISE